MYHFTGDKSRPTIVRSSIDIGTSSTVVEFLTELGCRMDFEYIVRGYMFRKGRMKITVSKIFKVIIYLFSVVRDGNMSCKPVRMVVITQLEIFSKA